MPNRDTRRRRILAVVIVLAAVQALAVLVYLRVERQRSAVRSFVHHRATGERLPSMVLERADGTTVQTDRYRGGRPVLLHFWATWCPPCRTELPTLLALSKTERDLEVLLVAMDREWPEIAAYFQGRVPNEIVRDPSETLGAAFGLTTLPDTYLLDPDGVAHVRFHGARDWQSPAAERVLRHYVRRLGAAGE